MIAKIKPEGGGGRKGGNQSGAKNISPVCCLKGKHNTRTNYNTDPEEEDINDEDLDINGDEEFLNFNYPLGSKLKEDEEAEDDAPLNDEDTGEEDEE